jgi:hypothetical protein
MPTNDPSSNDKEEEDNPVYDEPEGSVPDYSNENYVTEDWRNRQVEEEEPPQEEDENLDMGEDGDAEAARKKNDEVIEGRMHEGEEEDIAGFWGDDEE